MESVALNHIDKYEMRYPYGYMKLRNVGNALVVGIPKKLAEAMGWKAGEELNIEVAGKDRLVLRK